jgi:TatD DNase family protein
VLVDTHCHLDASYFPDGADAAIERARALGVDAFVCIGVGSLAAAKNALELAERRPDVVATAGVHPHDAASFDAELEAGLRPLWESDQLVAVGEVGLDYHYDHSPREAQQAVFRRFIEISREIGKPLVIHTRSAPADTLRILDEENARDVGGVIHCFSEDRDFARKAFDLGFDVSFSGIVTFKNSTAIQDVAAWAPADRILVETDSPYLAPVPVRGKPCEPAYVVHTARRVAELRGLSLEELAEISTQNAIRRFGPALDRAASAMQTMRDGH